MMGFVLHTFIQVKDRNLDDKEDGEEGEVENGGDCKNKGFGFVSFQASENNIGTHLLVLPKSG